MNWPKTSARFLFVAAWIALASLAMAQDKSRQDFIWTDLQKLGVEGRGWTETKSDFDRLPAKAEGQVREPVWNLSRSSSGLLVRFLTDATDLSVTWVLTSSNLAMPHMAATGVSGVDLYVRDGTTWRWLAVGMPHGVTNTADLVRGAPVGAHEYLLYLPLYNGVREVKIGVPPGAQLAAAGPWGKGVRKPIVFYGTSILQGACASRPGMVHSSILGRRFNWPTINLGFSGNGRMEPELADLLAELDPAVYVLDCLPNLGPKDVTQRVEPFVTRLRGAHPKVPIVLVEDRVAPNAFFNPGRAKHHADNHAALRAAYERLRKAGVKNLYYIEGANLLGADGDGTADGSHPTDLGFYRQADVIGKVLQPLLKPQ